MTTNASGFKGISTGSSMRRFAVRAPAEAIKAFARWFNGEPPAETIAKLDQLIRIRRDADDAEKRTNHHEHS